MPMAANEVAAALPSELQEEIRRIFGWKFAFSSARSNELRFCVTCATQIHEVVLQAVPHPRHPLHTTTGEGDRGAVEEWTDEANASGVPLGRLEYRLEQELALQNRLWSRSQEPPPRQHPSQLPQTSPTLNPSRPRPPPPPLSLTMASSTSSCSSLLDKVLSLYENAVRIDPTKTTNESLNADINPEEMIKNPSRCACANLSVLKAVCTMPDHLLVVLDYDMHTLQDVVRLNRRVGDQEPSEEQDCSLRQTIDLKKRFLVYQLVETFRFLHLRNISFDGRLTPKTLALTQHLWLRLNPFLAAQTEVQGIPMDVGSSRSLTELWIDREITNFDYLMAMNTAAGRKLIDSTYHPFLPWVSDFSSPNGGWRDLSKSKFRLNKGDNQLDRTYESSVIPHHITESLSEITYYIYMARRTPMHLLRQVVRSNFQPKEYPSTMTRLFTWTPDECIPAFFTDAKVFESLHGESTMNDLQVPEWCDHDPVAFVKAHRAMLECEQVSAQLHLWIDLNFGVSLSGEEAKKQKNVPLEVAGGNDPMDLTKKSPGFVQLFDRPHPRRRSILSEPSDHPPFKQSHSSLDFEVEMACRYRAEESHQMVKQAHEIVTELLETSHMESLQHSFHQRSQHSSSVGSSASPPSSMITAETPRGALIPRPKPRRKSKGRPKSYTPEHHTSGNAASAAASPTASSRSPKVGRLANAIPKFFTSESSSSGTSNTLTQSLHESNVPLGLQHPIAIASSNVDSRPLTMSASTPSFRTLAIGSTFGPLTPVTPSGSGGSSTTMSTSSGIGPSEKAGASHLLRDLWQQLSKNEDESNEKGLDIVDSVASNHGAISFSLPHAEFDYSDQDYDFLEDSEIRLLQTSLPIKLSPENELVQQTERSISQTHDLEARFLFCAEADLLLDATYKPTYQSLVKMFPNEMSVSSESFLAQKQDLFSLGCIIVEIFTTKPLFSKQSMQAFMQMYEEDIRCKENGCWRWLNWLRAKVKDLPPDVQHLVLALLHPNPLERSFCAELLDGVSPSGHVSRCRHQPLDGFEACETKMFPREFRLVYKFMASFHQANNWHHRFQTCRGFLPALLQLPMPLFNIVLPVVLAFFRVSSGNDVERVALAVVCLAPKLMEKLGAIRSSQQLLPFLLRVYESQQLNALAKACLCSPEMLQTIIKAFGNGVFVEHFMPPVVEWFQLAVSSSDSPIARSPSSKLTQSVLFEAECLALGAFALGEIASTDQLGPCMAAKYLLPALLVDLGKVRPRWQKIAAKEASTITSGPSIKRMSSLPSSTGSERNPSTRRRSSGTLVMHVTCLDKDVLDQPHFLADAVLNVCVEVGEVPITTTLLPHVMESLPKLIALAEQIGSRRTDGVPPDLGREIYVLLRILRRVSRNIHDVNVLRQILIQRADNKCIMELLAMTNPPFYNPVSLNKVKRRLQMANESSTTSGTGSTGSRQEPDLSVLPLRGFIVVGLARTIVGICRQIGVDSIVSSSSVVVEGINHFLTKCAQVYSQLEVNDFQWGIASEVVSEFCMPFRHLLGKETFEKLFPIVTTHSAIQLLLLPLQQELSSYSPQERSGYSNRMEEEPDTSDSEDHKEPAAQAELEENQSYEEEKRWIRQCPVELLEFAYKSTLVNGLPPRGFELWCRPEQMLTAEVKREAKIRQDQRKKRKKLSYFDGAPGSNNSSGTTNPSSSQQSPGAFDCVWLRPLTSKPLVCKSVIKTNEGHFDDGMPSIPFMPASGTTRKSWMIEGEIACSFKAHSSGVRYLHVDPLEEIVLTASKSNSCRAWRLAHHPCSTQSGLYCDSSVVAIKRAAKDYEGAAGFACHAIVAETSCVSSWDFHTNHVDFRVPFGGDDMPSLNALHVFDHHLMALAASGWSQQSFEMAPSATANGIASVATGCDFAVSTAKSVFCIDSRSGPKVVAEYRGGAGSGALYSRDASLVGSGPSSGGSNAWNFSCLASVHHFLAVGTHGGFLLLLDSRTGRLVTKWQALEAHVIKIVQYSSQLVVVVSNDREAKVWQVTPNPTCVAPRLVMQITGLPDGLRESQVQVERFVDSCVMFVSFANRMGMARLPTDQEAHSIGIKRSSFSLRFESFHLAENAHVATSMMMMNANIASAGAVSNASVVVSSSGASGVVGGSTGGLGGVGAAGSLAGSTGGGSQSNNSSGTGSGSASGPSSGPSGLAAIRPFRTKIFSQALGILPLRQLVLVGTDDGYIKTIV